MPVAIDVTANNPAAGAAFRKFCIQTMRVSLDDDFVEAFATDEEPFDEELGTPYFSLYTIGEDDLLEHIAERATYSAAVELACKLAAGIVFKKRLFVFPWPIMFSRALPGRITLAWVSTG